MAEAYEWFDHKRTLEMLDESQVVQTNRDAKKKSEDEQDKRPLPGLKQTTQTWYDQLPAKIQPQVLRCKFPHILDKLAQCWDAPRQLDGVFNELMVDDRGDRSGFPFSAIREMHCLRDFYFEVLNPEAVAMLKPRGGLKGNL